MISKAVKSIAELEKDLFSLFGWTICAFVNSDNYVVLMQMMATYRHMPINMPDKVKSSKPAIELYILPVVEVNGTYLFKDLWQGIKFPVEMIYPLQTVDFKSNRLSYPLHLQLPWDPFSIMEYLYSN